METDSTDDPHRLDGDDTPWNFDEVFAAIDDELAHEHLTDEQRRDLERGRASLLESQAELNRLAAERTEFIVAHEAELAAREADLAATEAELAATEARLAPFFAESGLDRAAYDEATPEKRQELLDAAVDVFRMKRLHRFYSGDPADQAELFSDGFTDLQDAIDAFRTLGLPRDLRRRMFVLLDDMADQGVKLPAFPTFVRVVDSLFDHSNEKLQEQRRRGPREKKRYPDKSTAKQRRDRRNEVRTKLREILAHPGGVHFVSEWVAIVVEVMEHALADGPTNMSAGADLH